MAHAPPCSLCQREVGRAQWLDLSGECSVSEYSIVHISSFYAKTQLSMSGNKPFTETLIRL